MDELEDLLRRFRPLGPPADLRERIGAWSRHARLMEWWPSVAAAAAVVILYTLAADSRRDLAPPPPLTAQDLASEPERVKELLVRLEAMRLIEESGQP